MTLLETTQRSISRIREKSDAAILFCSFGKDSLVLLDLMYPHFKRLVLVFMYFVPGLDHIERYVRWAESRYPGIIIDQVPHWTLTRIMRHGLFCTPRPDVKLLSLADINENMRLKHGIQYSFFGMKKADSLNRRLMLGRYGEGYENNGNVYPLADWTQKDIMSYMRMRQLPEPVRYSKNASGGLGFNLDCYLWMRRNAPQDLERVLQAFPMSGKILFDYDHRRTQQSDVGNQ